MIRFFGKYIYMFLKNYLVDGHFTTVLMAQSIFDLVLESNFLIRSLLAMWTTMYSGL